MHQKHAMNEQREVLDWASKIPYEKHHENNKSKVLEGTGKWLFRHTHFISWRDWGGSKILWLHGSAGSGKSTLVLVWRFQQSCS
jgi:hypothetical protein